MAESLSRKLEVERIVGNLPGIKIVQGVKSLNHSQFADDTFLLGGASYIIDSRLKNEIDLFTAVLGGMINHYKSQVLGWNFKTQAIQVISRISQFS